MPSERFLIVGARFRPPAQDVLMALPAGADLILRRQPDNPYDENAVAVMVQLFSEIDGYYLDSISETVKGILDNHFTEEEKPTFLHLGFIPRERAAGLAPRIDLQADPDTMIAPDVPGKLTFATNGAPMIVVGEDA